MQNRVEDFFHHLRQSIDGIQVTTKQGEPVNFPDAVARVIELLLERHEAGGRIMFIGNGASAAISSHMATDYTKAGGMRATAFNDGALLTCMGNDYGYEHVFEKPIEILAGAGDTLFAISSSGKSLNILNGVKAALAKPCNIITLSGFKEDNPLRGMGDMNFYVPSGNYGSVEILHHSICHCILDTMIMSQKQVQ